MVTTRKPKTTARKRRETLEEKFERLRAEPLGTPVKLTKREGLYFLKRLSGIKPAAPSGVEVMREFYQEPIDEQAK